jgi:L-ascorbate metabolism protein UlaG (beta-lactamase superfamily)
MHRRQPSALAGVAGCLTGLAMAGFVPAHLDAQTDTYPTADGAIRITPFAGAGVQLEHRGMVIHVDPWSRGDYGAALPADVILITDTPADHLDPALIGRLRKPGTVVIVPADPATARDAGGAERLRAVEGATVMLNDETISLDLGGDGSIDVVVDAVAMYDLIPGEPFHAKGEGNGYVVTLGGVRIYLAGVTECTPEMQAVRDVDVAFVPMNLPNGRMPPTVAADCVRIIDPRVVYPYHYREIPIDDFVEALRGSPIEVRVRDWYPPA